jgi:hypothetical protein
MRLSKKANNYGAPSAYMVYYQSRKVKPCSTKSRGSKMSNHQKLHSILRKIQELALEAESLAAELPTRRAAPGSNEQTESLLRASYDFEAGAFSGSWKTCATVCYEIGIEQTRANCSMVGRCLSSIGAASRRSHGKNLVFMPPLKEIF